jgi:aerobic-type carbon monoxide dehydrogenase small subunit (CoxS/CutS family)
MAMTTGNSVAFRVNGKEVEIPLKPGRSLLQVLRLELGLTGAKHACDGEGICGMCTVIVDHVAQPACQIPLDQMSGREVETIEGLARDGNLHALQKAYVLEHVMQCGYATPGQIMSAKALLDRNPNPSLEQAAEALRYNILAVAPIPPTAIERWLVAERDVELEWNEKIAAMERLAVSKVMGSLKYTDDLTFPVLYGRASSDELTPASRKSM